MPALPGTHLEVTWSDKAERPVLVNEWPVVDQSDHQI